MKRKSDGKKMCVGKIIFVLYSEESHTLNNEKKKKKRCKVFKVMCSILP